MNNQDLFYFNLDSPTEATARIYGDIGTEVVASQFVQELTSVQNHGVTSITIRINSCGGSVIDGFAIFSALQNAKATITTVNDGLAASTAGWLFLAGDKAVAADYSLLMLHNPYSADNSAKGAEILTLMRKSILTILSKRTGTKATKIGKLMDAETWYDASQCLELGFATAIQETEQLIKLEPTMQNAKAMFQICNSALLESETEETETKNQVEAEVTTEEALLVENNTEDCSRSHVEDQTSTNSDVQVANELEEKPEDEEKAALKAQIAELVTANEQVQAELASVQVALNAYKEAETSKELAAKELLVTNLVTSALEAGKIKAEAKTHWLELATNNYDIAKATLESLVVAKTAPKVMDKVKQLNSTSIAEGKAPMKLREMEIKNPKEVERLYKEERETYNQLYFNQYNKYPN